MLPRPASPLPQVRPQEKITLTVGTAASPAWSIGQVMTNVLKPGLEKHSNGRIEVVLHGGGSLCSEQGCVEQMRLGQIDIATVSSGNVGAFGTTFDLINLPYLFKDHDAANRILNGWLAEELSQRAEKEMKVHTIAIIPVGGFRNVVNTQREVKVPADLKGLKIRVTKSPSEFNLLRPGVRWRCPTTGPSSTRACSPASCRACTCRTPSLRPGKFTEVIKHVTAVVGAYSAHPILMNLDRYNKLPAWAREAIDKTGADLMREGLAYDANGTSTPRRDARQGAVYTPNADELTLWHTGAKDAWVAVRKTYDPALARRVLEEQGQQELVQDLVQAKAL